MSEAFLGEIRMFAGDYPPRGWAICDGSLLPVQSYEALFVVLGTTYGGNGVTTFGLPDYRGRVPVGQGQGVGLRLRTLGTTMGSETVTMTTANTPAHTHAFMVSRNPATSATPNPPAAPKSQTFGAFASAGVIKGLYSTQAASPVSLSPLFLSEALVPAQKAPLPHDNMMGSLAINYIICLSGIFPTRP
nr:tail fiber protein [Pseudomonas sp. FFPRI_1]